MKAEIKKTELAEMLQDQIHNGASQSDIIQIIEEYARIQIENRTDEIIGIIKQHPSWKPNERLVEKIKDLPINLD